MKRLILILLAGSFVSIGSPGRDDRRMVNLVSIHMVTPLTGWGTDQTRVLHTADGSRHWQVFSSGLSRQNVAKLDFVTPTVGFTVESIGASSRTRLLETNDSGRSWNLVPAQLGPLTSTHSAGTSSTPGSRSAGRSRSHQVKP